MFMDWQSFRLNFIMLLVIARSRPCRNSQVQILDVWLFLARPKAFQTNHHRKLARTLNSFVGLISLMALVFPLASCDCVHRKIIFLLLFVISLGVTPPIFFFFFLFLV